MDGGKPKRTEEAGEEGGKGRAGRAHSNNSRGAARALPPRRSAAAVDVAHQWWGNWGRSGRVRDARGAVSTYCPHNDG